MKMETPHMVQEILEKLKQMFPEVITESKDENGEIVAAVDAKKLEQLLSTKVIEGDECYDFTWVGKKQAIVEACKPISKTLRPCREESVVWENTQNLYIEGDNLDVLKLLQESYLNKVKMIYIDPPYNTGNDSFIYPDDYAENKDKYDEEVGAIDESGYRMFKNTKTNGRFHSSWCSMMYPRLKLARNLLSEDGVIFISIDDNEVHNLRKLCDEVFGEENFRNQITVRRGTKSVQAQFDTWDKLGQDVEHILFYTKNSNYRFPKQTKKLDEEKPGSWNNHWRGTDRPTMRYELFGITPESGQWRWGKERSLIAIENYKKMLSELGETENTITQEKIDAYYMKQQPDFDLLRLSKTGKPEHYVAPTDSILLNTSWQDLLIGSSAEILDLFETKVFDTAKLTAVVKRMLGFCEKDKNDIVLDFFSGSATTAHAVMQLNAEDGGNRQFIMVQLPEVTDEKSEAFKAGYKNICEIGKERIRRAGRKIVEETGKTDLDIGFRVLKLDDTNMKDVYYKPSEYSQTMLDRFSSNIKEDRTSEDLLYQCLLDWGLELSLPHEVKDIAGFTVHVVNENELIACFEDKITKSMVERIAEMKPIRVVFKDSSFATDADRINVTEIFKLKSPNTDIKVI